MSSSRKVHRREPAPDVFSSLHRNAKPACRLSLTRWTSIEISTTTNPAKVTCRRPGCQR